MSETLSTIAESNWGSHNGIASAAKYNPHLWSPEELRSIFVARQRELATILQVLKAAAPSVAPQHLLITGQRGMGKSTLLQRVALSVEDDVELSKTWLPLRFPEEQYTVSTPAELWANVIGALADALERQGQPAMEIDAEILRISGMSAADGEEEGLQWLHQWCIDNNRRLLLLIDSTDLLFSNLSEGTSSKRGKQGGGASALWRVRKALLHSSHFLWLGGSYQPLEVHGLYDDAFLDFFQLIELRPLSLVEMQNAIQAMARIFGAGRGLKGDEAAAEVKRMLDARPERLRAMRQLTGGNPRTTVMLYELFAAGGRDNVRADLERLLDSMTPLYKSKLEVLADQPRKVLAHVMEHWAPITAKALAQSAALSSGTISAQLSRLEQEGLIEKTALSGTKRFGYQCGERFFNIWYLMRNAPRGARARVGWLVEFMRLWYSNDELQGLARKRWGRHSEGLFCDDPELEYSRAIARAMPEDAHDRHLLEWAVFQQARKGAAFHEIFEIEGDDSDYSTANNYLNRFEALQGKLEMAPVADRSSWVKELKRAFHLTLAEKEEIANTCGHLSSDELSEVREELANYRNELISNHDDASVEYVEQAIFNGKFFPDCPDSKLAFTQLIDCFLTYPNAFAAALGRLVNRCKDSQSEAACKKAIEIAPESARAWNIYGHLLRSYINRLDEAELAYRKAIELDSVWVAPYLSLGRLLANQLKRFEEAEEIYRKAIRLQPKSTATWTALANVLGYELNKFEEAEEAYRRAIEIDSKFAASWGGLGDLFSGKLNRLDEAEMAYRKAIECNQKWPAPYEALGDLLGRKLNRFDEAEVFYRKSIDLDPNRTSAWRALGDLLRFKCDRPKEAEIAYRKVIEINPKLPGPWRALGDVLGWNLNSLVEAEAAYRQAIKINEEWAGPWGGLGDLLSVKLNRFVEAEVAYRTAIKLNPAWAAPWRALGNMLGQHLNRFDEAEVAYRKAIEISPKRPDSWAKLGNLLSKLNRLNEAEEAYRAAIQLDPKWAKPWNDLGELLVERFNCFEESENAFRKAIELNSRWAIPHGNLGWMLDRKLNRLGEAEIAYRKAIDLDPTITWVWHLLGELLACKLNRPNEAEVAYRKAIELNPEFVGVQVSLGNLLQDQLKDYSQAELAYREAIRLASEEAVSVANLARLLTKMGRNQEANTLYRESLKLAEEDDQNLILQAHCWLGNSDLAMQSLDKLAESAIKGNSEAFFQLKEQCFECHAIGLGDCLFKLMEKSHFANFLLPFSVALRVASGEANALLDVAVEVRGMAEDVLLQINRVT